jgi:hypothetical protein
MNNSLLLSVSTPTGQRTAYVQNKTALDSPFYDTFSLTLKQFPVILFTNEDTVRDKSFAYFAVPHSFV